mgnify:CR=1 FL=1
MKAEGKMISITLDHGKTWIPCPNGVRVNIENLPIDGEDLAGCLVFHFTNEGVITDVWVINEDNEDENMGTSAKMFSDIVYRLVESNNH